MTEEQINESDQRVREEVQKNNFFFLIPTANFEKQKGIYACVEK